MNKIITVSREFGSGGRELAQQMAERLGFQYYDKEIIAEMVKQSKFDEAYIENVANAASKDFPYAVSKSMAFYSAHQKQTTEILVLEKKIIQQLAAKGDCVFVGRSADIILSEYGTTVVGLEMLRSVNEENAEENRKIAVVKSAISTLSFSEMEAITHIFDEMNGMEGILVASKIADRVGITRSVIVNALRKFESAGVIESRSSGMKGTYIKVLNDVVFSEIEELKRQNQHN